jgi:L-2-hydroxyglutarate oxidase LhgO
VSLDFDAVVVGAGAVGLACGHALAARGQAVLVLEAERAVGQGVSSRNSEVIHAGLYYATGSLKARLCVEGRRALYPFLEARGIAFDRCGKLVVATEESERAAVERIADQAVANGVEGCRLLDRAETLAVEPQLRAVMSLLSPESGLFDSHAYMLALQAGIEDAGGLVQLAAPFEGASALAGGGWSVRGGGAEVTTARLVTAPGLGAQGVAALIDGFPAERIPRAHYGKGCYFSLSGRAPFSRLIYRRRSGRAGHALSARPERARRVRPRSGVRGHRGLPRRRGAGGELLRLHPAVLAGAAGRGAQPGLRGHPPQAARLGRAAARFRHRRSGRAPAGGLVCLFGIESPGLTSSLAIGEAVAKALDA